MHDGDTHTFVEVSPDVQLSQLSLADSAPQIDRLLFTEV